jgi:hypothetical protein
MRITPHSAVLATALALATLAGAHLASPPDAAAQDASAQVTVRIIVGSTEAGGVPESLASVGSQLTRQFPRFASFTLHSSTNATIAEGDSQRIGTPGGGTASITFTGSSNGALLFTVEIPGGTTQVTMPANSVFFVGGSQIPGGELIVMLDT